MKIRVSPIPLLFPEAYSLHLPLIYRASSCLLLPKCINESAKLLLLTKTLNPVSYFFMDDADILLSKSTCFQVWSTVFSDF